MSFNSQISGTTLADNGSSDAFASAAAATRLLKDAQAVIGTDASSAMDFITKAVSLLEKDPRDERVKARGGLARWQIMRIERHIEENLGEPIHIAALAAMARLSPGYFSNAFKVSFGTSPHAYIITRRLTRAMETMKSTANRLCEIAIDCGFSDQAHLCRQFRRAMGVSPNAWRRHARELAIQ